MILSGNFPKCGDLYIDHNVLQTLLWDPGNGIPNFVRVPLLLKQAAGADVHLQTPSPRPVWCVLLQFVAGKRDRISYCKCTGCLKAQQTPGL